MTTRVTFRYPRTFNLILVLVAVCGTLVLLEGAFRAARYIVRGANSLATVDDPELGWVHNTQRPRVVRMNSCGEETVTLPAPSPYLIRVPHQRDGKRILFLGDSSTHAHEVSTGSAYYDTVEAMGQGKYSIWAAGVGGYGNLQEYLLLRKVYDEVRPEILVWQLDSNDIVNNVYRLDRGTILNNVKPRPYMDPDTGVIDVRDPGLLLFKVSQGARYLLPQFVGLDIRLKLGLVAAMERWIGPAPDEQPTLAQQGLRVLERVLAEAVERYPQTRFVGFSISSGDDAEYAKIFARHHAEYWPNFSARVRASDQRTDCLPWDGHWNHAGNRVAGRLISDFLEKL